MIELGVITEIIHKGFHNWLVESILMSILFKAYVAYKLESWYVGKLVVLQICQLPIYYLSGGRKE